MSSFVSNIESLNSGALQSARHNDTHSNDAYLTLITNIYTAAPNAVIVQSGVNYRVTTNDFQAWALYYNADILPAYSVDGINNKLEILSANVSNDNYLQVGQYQVITNPPNATPGDYFCIFVPEFGIGVPIADADAYYIFMSQVIKYPGVFSITWENSGIYYKSDFVVGGTDNVDGALILYYMGGDAIPSSGGTGRYGIRNFGI